MADHKLRVSVGELVEFVYKSGDIRAVFLSASRAVDGIKAHQRIQQRFSEQYQEFEAEVAINCEIANAELMILVNGRTDGIIKDYNTPIICEIKSAAQIKDIEENYSQLHWAQAKIYAYMYARQNNLNEIMVHLTYVQLGSYDIKQFERSFTYRELEEFMDATLTVYLQFARLLLAYNNAKAASIKELQFPFSNYRKGQKQLVSSVYRVIMTGDKLFARAPTGIGKTMGTLFPAIKALDQRPRKIFYLTAKTIGRDVAEKALNLLARKGLVLKRIIITAKDKICLNDERKCDSAYCAYAKGHFDRINDALTALITATDHYSRDVIIDYAERFQVCPHELSLDLSLYCDCIICDYNYAFDPSAILRRYFSEGAARLHPDSSYIFLIDEAHNLVDRARSMYSAVLSKKAILELKKKVKQIDQTLYGYLNDMNKFLIRKRHECAETNQLTEDAYAEEFVDLIWGFIHRLEKIYAQLAEGEQADQLLEFYFECYDFVKRIDLYDERYVTIYQKNADEVTMKIFCIDPSANLKMYLTNAEAAVLFSATLTPINYFVQILGGDDQSYGLTLTSPFDSRNLCLLVNNGISTKYLDRPQSYQKVVETVYQTVKGKTGNYLVFFPSYQYLEAVYQRWVADKPGIEVMKQGRGISESEKEEFLAAFKVGTEQTLVAFVVLGGMFGEGIDLVGEKLSGAVIVGVGLPAICLERDIIRGYFDQSSNNGFQYAYLYPGMNKVMQAAGRVIRTASDVGIVVLIDRRFGHSNYRELFPPEWSQAVYESSVKLLADKIKCFWLNSRS